MIRYYHSHIRWTVLFKLPFVFRANHFTIEYFKKHSGKKYILLTPSSRIALYLAHAAINKRGLVLSSPLTCQSALDPIIWSGNNILFSDIDPNSLNLDPLKAISLLKQNSQISSIQIINHGGLSSYHPELYQFARDKGLKIIEDCAQSFGAVDAYTGKYAGYHADVACYSLIKNAYGIGGGILATDDKLIYTKAKSELVSQRSFPWSKIIYRFILSSTDSYTKNSLGGWINRSIKNIRHSNQIQEKDISELSSFFIKPPAIFFKIFKVQSKKFFVLHKKRNIIAQTIISDFRDNALINNYYDVDLNKMSFTKLFIYHPEILSSEAIRFLTKEKIEAKHLEQRQDSRVQKAFFNSVLLNYSIGLDQCLNYREVHDHIISLPLYEQMNKKEIHQITKAIKTYLCKHE